RTTVAVSLLSNLTSASCLARCANGVSNLTLRLIFCAGPDDMTLVAGFAKALKDAVVRRNAKHEVPGGENPRLGEHDRILDGRLIDEHVAMAGVAFDHVLLIAMNQGLRLHNLMSSLPIATGFRLALSAAEPRFIVQTNDVDDQGIAFPVADGIAQEGAVEVLRMAAPIRVNA